MRIASLLFSTVFACLLVTQCDCTSNGPSGDDDCVVDDDAADDDTSDDDTSHP